MHSLKIKEHVVLRVDFVIWRLEAGIVEQMEAGIVMLASASSSLPDKPTPRIVRE
jgi:hypothetical protein